MNKYGASLLKKIGLGAVTLWGVSVVVFALLFIVPGWKPMPVPPGKTKQEVVTDAIAQSIAGERADPAIVANVKRSLGLDQPLLVQYGRFVSGALTNNLVSYRNGDHVMSAIARRFPATLLLALAALCVWMLAAIPLGLTTAKNAGGILDRGSLLLGLIAISIPTFWLGRLLQHALGYELRLFGVGGDASLVNLPLPALTLGIGGAAYYSRLLHANLRGVMRQEYIRASRARGLSETQVMGKHALKNALIPVVAVLGLDIAGLLTGLIFTEKIFGWPGIGSLAVDSVSNGDIPMIMGTVLFSAFVVVVANILVDVAYRVIDPRVRLD